MNKIAKVIAVAGCAATLLSGCSSAKGGDTTCADFNKMDGQQQTDVIKQMLKEDKGKDVSNLEAGATKISAKAFCATLGKDSSKIRDINTG